MTLDEWRALHRIVISSRPGPPRVVDDKTGDVVAEFQTREEAEAYANKLKLRRNGRMIPPPKRYWEQLLQEWRYPREFLEDWYAMYYYGAEPTGHLRYEKKRMVWVVSAEAEAEVRRKMAEDEAKEKEKEKEE